MLQNAKILVTGASSGIGLATALLLAKNGAKIAATGRSEAALRAHFGQSGGSSTTATIIAADLTAEGECKRVVDAAAASLGGLTALVNCAGVLQGAAFGSEKATLANFDFNFGINTRVVWQMMQHAVPHLKAAGKAANPAMVNVSSVNGKHSFGGTAAYCASKAAVDMLTRCAAIDLAEFNVRVNAVNPGVVRTELQKRGGLDAAAYEAFVKRSVEITHPLAKGRGTIGEPNEVAELISFLLSDKALFITGECIAIDGGRQCLGAR